MPFSRAISTPFFLLMEAHSLHCQSLPQNIKCISINHPDAPRTALPNIVGYTGNGLQDGGTCAGPAFFPVSGEKINLNSIVPSGYAPVEGVADGGTWGDEIYVQKLTFQGKTEVSYYWYDCIFEELWDKTNVEVKGWFTKDDWGNPVPLEEDVMITPGDGFFIFGVSTDNKITTSGAVGREDLPVTLRDGGTVVANATSVKAWLNGTAKGNWNGIWATGYEEPTGVAEGGTWGDEIYIQKLTFQGKTEISYYWYDCIFEELWDETGVAVYGWYTKDDWGNPVPLEENVSFEPGEGVFVFGVSTDNILHFPKAKID